MSLLENLGTDALIEAAMMATALARARISLKSRAAALSESSIITPRPLLT